MNLQPGVEHFSGESYDSKERFISYWHQIHEIISLKPKTVLEVGVGNGFLARYLRGNGWDVTTVDIVSELRPDVTGSVLSMPFEDAAFDVVACFEVLEHLPYDDFTKALEELRRVSRRYVVLSVPDHTAIYRVNIELPRMKPIRRLVPHPFPRPPSHEFDGEHYWIIGKSNYPLDKITRDIVRTGLKIIDTYRIFEFYGHRFFSLEKSS